MALPLRALIALLARSQGGLLAGERWAAGGGGGYLGPSRQTPGTHRSRAEGSLLHSWHCRGAASSPVL